VPFSWLITFFDLMISRRNAVGRLSEQKILFCELKARIAPAEAGTSAPFLFITMAFQLEDLPMSFADRDIVEVVREMGGVSSRTNLLALSVDRAILGQAISAERCHEIQALKERCAEASKQLAEAIADASQLKKVGFTPGPEFRLRVDHFVSTAKYLQELSTPDRKWTDAQGKNDLVLLKLIGIDLFEQFEAVKHELASEHQRSLRIVSLVRGEKPRNRGASLRRWKLEG